MTDKLSVSQGAIKSQTLPKCLQALHESQKAFIQSEANEHIRRALQYKI